ncbi:MAG TPA: TolC family protein, partial [Oceanipulchritudo sp.]|nr:TolC family protein [Oceanipulchritudo sp.]
LEAIAQVEDLVYTETRLSELLQRLERRQQLLEEAESQAVSRYEQGFTDFLPVITARQDLLTIEQRLVRERANLLLARLNLHRVLGGPMPQR